MADWRRELIVKKKERKVKKTKQNKKVDRKKPTDNTAER